MSEPVSKRLTKKQREWMREYCGGVTLQALRATLQMHKEESYNCRECNEIARRLGVIA